jgi:hypothetical protein
MRYLLLAVVLLTNCVRTENIYEARQQPTQYAPPKDCKIIGTKRFPNAAVLIQRSCLKKGLTTIAVVIYSFNQPDTVRNTIMAYIKTTLGFTPKLALISIAPYRKGLLRVYAVVG